MWQRRADRAQVDAFMAKCTVEAEQRSCKRWGMRPRGHFWNKKEKTAPWTRRKHMHSSRWRCCRDEFHSSLPCQLAICKLPRMLRLFGC